MTGGHNLCGRRLSPRARLMGGRPQLPLLYIVDVHMRADRKLQEHACMLYVYVRVVVRVYKCVGAVCISATRENMKRAV